MYLFRKNRFNFEVEKIDDNQIVYAPVTGKIVEIVPDLDLYKRGELFNCLKINVSLIDEYGIFLPIKSQVSQLKRLKNCPYFRTIGRSLESNLAFGKQIILQDKRDKKIIIQIVSSKWSFPPHVFIGPGDRGEPGALIGLLPFGHTVLLFISKDKSLKVKQGDKLEAYQSIIAS